MRFLDRVYCGLQTINAHLRGRRTPICVYLNITSRCPNKCIYCNYPNLEAKKNEEMTTAQILKLIDELAEAGTKRLQITGGEPMVRRDIGEVIDHAKKKKRIFTGISSSGIFIAERIKEIKNVNIIFLSLDGERDVHDSIRGKGSYDQVMRAIESMKDHNIRFWTTTVINRKNIDSVDDILGMAKSLGFTANFVLYYYVNDYDKDHLSPESVINDLALSDDENREIIQSLIRKKKEGEPVGSSYNYFNYLLKWKDFGTVFSNEEINGVKCWAGHLYCHVDPKGTVYPCGVSYWRVKGYSAVELGFKKAFELSRTIPCKSCIFACHLEHNLLFSLDTQTILDWSKNLRKDKYF